MSRRTSSRIIAASGEERKREGQRELVAWWYQFEYARYPRAYALAPSPTSSYYISGSNVTGASQSRYDPTIVLPRENAGKSRAAPAAFAPDDPARCQLNANFEAANREIGFSKLFPTSGRANAAPWRSPVPRVNLQGIRYNCA